MKKINLFILALLIFSILTPALFASEEKNQESDTHLITIPEIHVPSTGKKAESTDQPEIKEPTSASPASSAPVKSKIPSNHEIYFGYGYLNSISTVFVNGTAALMTAIFSGDTQKLEVEGIGIFQLGYNWYFYEGISLGAKVVLEPYRLVYTNTKDPTKNKKENQMLSSFQAGLGIQYGWEKIRLYHNATAGIGILTSESSSEVSPVFVFNIVLVGMKVGPEKGPNFFADVGFGSTSVLNLGMTYRF